MCDVEVAKKLLTGDTVIDLLKRDPEVYYSWQANIAMSFVDAYSRDQKRYKNHADIHSIANEAARHFLDLLIK